MFTIECSSKIVAYGFCCNGKKSYLRQANNCFDFVIVCSALVSRAYSGGGSATKTLGYLKILRTARVLRPLRIISRSEGLTIAINALIKSVPQMVNLFFFCILVFFLFGIFGVNYFKGAFYACDFDHIPLIYKAAIESKWDCMDYGGDWIKGDTNFDNIFEAMTAMFKVAMTEGWLDIMF